MKFKYLFLMSSLSVAALFYFTISPDTFGFLPKCPLYSTTGIYCPGCGSQRATHNLLHLDFSGAIHHNVLYLLILILLAYHGVIVSVNRLFNKKWKSVLNHPRVPIMVLLVIILFWILRNLPYAPFNFLAPHP